MANGNETVANVDLDVDGAPVNAAIDLVNQRIAKIQASIAKIVTSANDGARNFDQKLQQTVKALQASLSQISTLEKSLVESTRQGAAPIRTLTDNQALSRATTQASNYAKTLDNARTAAEALEARLNSVQKKIADLGATGTLASRKDLAQQLNTKKAISDLDTLNKQLERLDARARRSGADTGGARSDVLQARSSLLTATLNPRRTNFDTEINAVADAQARYEASIKSATLSQTEALKLAKERAATEVDAAAKAGTLDKERLASETRLAAAREQMATASMSEARDLLKVVDLEKSRLALIEREQRAQQTPGQKPSALQNILSPGYLGAAAARTGIYGITAGLGYGAFNAIQDGAKFVLEFDDALKQLQAISGATDTQLTTLSETIVKVSENSKFSTIEITKAATTLAQAGFSVQDMQKALGSVTTLAAASGSTPTEAVEILTSAIGAFQLQTSEAARVTDVLVAALNRSKLNITQVGQAIQYVGATAYENNISLEQLVATAGALSNAGVKSGSTIGTGLREFLIGLQNPTKQLSEQMARLGISFQDIDVKTRGLPGVIQTLSDKGFGAAQAYAGLETRAAAAFLVLKNNIATYNQLILAEAQQGAAADANAKAMDSLSAQWQRFKNLLNENIDGGLKDTLDTLKGVVRSASDALDLIKKANDTDAAATIRKNSLASPTDVVAKLIAYYRQLGEEIGAYNGKTDQAAAANEKAATRVADTTAAVDGQTQTITSLDKEIDRLLLQHDSLSKNQVAAQAETTSLATRFQGLALQLGTTENKYYDLINALRSYRKEQLAALGSDLQAQVNAFQAQRGGLNIQGGVQIAAIKKSPIFSGLKLAEQAAVLAPTTGQNAAIVGDVGDKLAKSDPATAQLFYNLQKTASDFVLLGTQAAGAASALEQVKIRASNGGTRLSNAVETLEQTTNGLSSSATGKTPGQRRAIYAQAGIQADRLIAAVQTAAAQPNIGDSGRAFFADILTRLQSVKGQISSVVSPTQAEDRLATRAARQALAAQKKEDRNDTFVSQQSLKSSNLDLEGDLKDAGNAKTIDLLDKATQQANDALNSWIAARTDVMNDEIRSKGLDPGQAAEFRREVQAEIEEKRESVARSLTDAFTKFLAAQFKTIDDAYTAALRPTQRAVGVAEGLRSGLDRLPLGAVVPDYVRQLADRRVQQAQDNADQAQIPALETKLRQYTQLLDIARAKMAALNADAISNSPSSATSAIELGQMSTVVDDLNQKLGDTSDALAKIRASFKSGDLIPKTLGAGLSQAIDAYKQANGLNNSFVQNLNFGLTGALQSGQQAFAGFFNEMIEGSHNVATAFGGLVKGVLAGLAQMAEQAAAKAIFGALLNVAGSAFGGPKLNAINPGADTAGITSAILGRYRGGPIKRAGGGRVMNGFASHDSVNTDLARGEWVVQKSAVDSVGDDFMRDLNANGAKALQGLGNVPAIAIPSQEMKVYVTQPDQKPSLGPNDVLVVVQDDLLKDGATARLVKHVAQGG